MVCCGIQSKVPGVGACQECCSNYDCSPRITQPPAGEWGKPFCIDDVCKAGKENENGRTSPKISNDEYQVWAPSETIDNAKEYHGYTVPRILHSTEPTPVMDQVWYIDFKEQRDDFPFDEVSSNGTHIMIPIFEYFHAGYSKSYHQYDEHETGVVTLLMGDNEYSTVTDYPKNTFVEKYHTLTFNGKKDTARGDYILKKSKEHKDESPEFDIDAWRDRAPLQVLAQSIRYTVSSQVEAGIDRALSWQIRRFVNSHKPEDTGKVNPSSSSAWASHTTKAKQAIEYAKDPNFKREYMKSEQHCKHLEDNAAGVDYTDTHVIFPLGVPITMFTGEMINAPTHYLGLGVGHTTFHYDESSEVLQIYYSVHGISRQYPDVAYPGPEGGKYNGLWVSPVAEGKDYEIDMRKDSRSNVFLDEEQPSDDNLAVGHANFDLWNRPKDHICDPAVEHGEWWEHVDLSSGDNSVWDSIATQKSSIFGIAMGMLCAPIWMRADYGAGSHRFDVNEIGVWGHFLGEVRDEYDFELGTGVFWDDWECFYQNKDYDVCQGRGERGE